MKTRIITGVIGLPILIAFLYMGGLYRLALTVFLSVAAMWEFCHALNQKLENKMRFPLMLILTLGILAVMKLNDQMVMQALTVGFMIIFCSEVFLGKADAYRGIASVFALVYIPLMFGALLQFDYIPKGLFYIWMVPIIAFVTDTAAYFVGRAIGKRKLAPKISPKKTVEGAVGGIIFAAAGLTAYGFIVKQYFGFALPIWFYPILGIVGSIVSQCGDLTASMIKRKMEIKDFGKVLPGHGGILDRFDSILFTLPIVYIFATYTYSYL